MSIRITESTGNVFLDLGFDATESAELDYRSTLLSEVQTRIAARINRGDSQAAIAQLVGITQPRVSDLKRGKIHLFSSDALVKMLARLGARVQPVTIGGLTQASEVMTLTAAPPSGVFVATPSATWTFVAGGESVMEALCQSLGPLQKAREAERAVAANTQLTLAA